MLTVEYISVSGLIPTVKVTDYHVPFNASLFRAIAENVKSIQADGDELEAINDQFPHVLMSVKPGKRVHRFYGDTAKTIIGNLE